MITKVGPFVNADRINNPSFNLFACQGRARIRDWHLSHQPQETENDNNAG